MGAIYTKGGTERAGDIKFHAANSIPPGWLKANGAAVSRAAYAALFANIGTVFGVGDGATTFNLPDLRGEFVRGFDDARGADSGRAFGSAQAHQMQAHQHSFMSGQNVSGGVQAGMGNTDNQFANSTSTQGGTSNGGENRPRNVAMLACIKY